MKTLDRQKLDILNKTWVQDGVVQIVDCFPGIA